MTTGVWTPRTLAEGPGGVQVGGRPGAGCGVYGVGVHFGMRIVSVRHRGLKNLLESGEVRGMRRDLAARVENVLNIVVAAETFDGVRGPPGWRMHQLSGERAGTWSISVSGNWRITFRVFDDEIHDLNLEDYH